MSVNIRETIVVTGRIEVLPFTPDCVTGDTQELNRNNNKRIPFPPGLFQLQGEPVRVILTPQHPDPDPDLDPRPHVAAPVGIAQNVSVTGFDLRARNSDCAAGSAGFNWMAIQERRGEEHEVPSLRMRVLQPEHLDDAEFFRRSCESGDTHYSGVRFWRPMLSEPTVLLTPTNLNIIKSAVVRGVHDIGVYNPAAIVGIVQGQSTQGFNLKARNSDCAIGECAFFYVALSSTPGVPGDSGDLVVDTGEVSARYFAPDCVKGDIQYVGIDFHRPFLTPPVVLVTANDLGVTHPHNAAVVCMANNVTLYGFTIKARNSDCADGQAGFYWVAIGCSFGCG